MISLLSVYNAVLTYDNIKVLEKYMEITFIFIGNKTQILMTALMQFLLYILQSAHFINYVHSHRQ